MVDSRDVLTCMCNRRVLVGEAGGVYVLLDVRMSDTTSGFLFLEEGRLLPRFGPADGIQPAHAAHWATCPYVAAPTLRGEAVKWAFRDGPR